jgi:uncharacterized protein DUF6622
MQTLQIFLSNTPRWVWLVLAVLVALGLQALRPRRVKLARVLITPIVFLTWGLVGLVLTARGTPVALLDWAVAAAAGAALARLTFRTARLAVANGLVRFPGSPVPLLRNLLIFVVKFALAVALARLPDWHGDLVLVDAGVSGVIAGYFLGWMAQFIRFYRRAAPADLGLASRERAG